MAVGAPVFAPICLLQRGLAGRAVVCTERGALHALDAASGLSTWALQLTTGAGCSTAAAVWPGQLVNSLVGMAGGTESVADVSGQPGDCSCPDCVHRGGQRLLYACSDGDLHMLECHGFQQPAALLPCMAAREGVFSSPILVGKSWAIFGARDDALHCLQLDP